MRAAGRGGPGMGWVLGGDDAVCEEYPVEAERRANCDTVEKYRPVESCTGVRVQGANDNEVPVSGCLSQSSITKGEG
jgi:hypothetical protein